MCAKADLREAVTQERKRIEAEISLEPAFQV
jgi:hypothetical protein